MCVEIYTILISVILEIYFNIFYGSNCHSMKSYWMHYLNVHDFYIGVSYRVLMNALKCIFSQRETFKLSCYEFCSKIFILWYGRLSCKCCVDHRTLELMKCCGKCLSFCIITEWTDRQYSKPGPSLMITLTSIYCR